MDGIADHVGGPLLAFGTSGHQLPFPTFPQLTKEALDFGEFHSIRTPALSYERIVKYFLVASAVEYMPLRHPNFYEGGGVRLAGRLDRVVGDNAATGDTDSDDRGCLVELVFDERSRYASDVLDWIVQGVKNVANPGVCFHLRPMLSPVSIARRHSASRPHRQGRNIPTETPPWRPSLCCNALCRYWPIASITECLLSDVNAAWGGLNISPWLSRAAAIKAEKPAKFLGCRRRRTQAVGRVRMIEGDRIWPQSPPLPAVRGVVERPPT